MSLSFLRTGCALDRHLDPAGRNLLHSVAPHLGGHAGHNRAMQRYNYCERCLGVWTEGQDITLPGAVDPQGHMAALGYALGRDGLLGSLRKLGLTQADLPLLLWEPDKYAEPWQALWVAVVLGAQGKTMAINHGLQQKINSLEGEIAIFKAKLAALDRQRAGSTTTLPYVRISDSTTTHTPYEDWTVYGDTRQTVTVTAGAYDPSGVYTARAIVQSDGQTKWVLGPETETP